MSGSSPPPSNDPARPGAEGAIVGGRYRLETLLGLGGSAQVWRASVVGLDRDTDGAPQTGQAGPRSVAVKLLQPYLVADAAARDRLLEEARLVRRLDHPAIVALHDVVLNEDQCGLVFEFVAGGSLAAEVAGRGRLEPRRAASLVAALAEALDHVHERGVVHRDVTPRNVLLDETGGPRLADFGTACLVNEIGSPRASAETVGTLGYIAPEQLAGRPVDGRADLFSLGAVLYALLAGRAPFDAATPLGLAAQHRAGPPPLPADVPPALASLTLAALSRNPAARPQRAGDFAAALHAWLDGRAPEAAWLDGRSPAAAALLSDRPTQRIPAVPLSGPMLPLVVAAGRLAGARPQLRPPRPGGAAAGWRLSLAALSVAVALGAAGVANGLVPRSAPPVAGRLAVVPSFPVDRGPVAPVAPPVPAPAGSPPAGSPTRPSVTPSPAPAVVGAGGSDLAEPVSAPAAADPPPRGDHHGQADHGRGQHSQHGGHGGGQGGGLGGQTGDGGGGSDD